MWNIFFFKILLFNICFLFFIIFDILFSISSIFTCQPILEILMFFILWNRDFIKEFLKIMEYFAKKYRHLKYKILHKFHRVLLVFYLFYFFRILVIFFSYFTYPNLSKNSKHYCGALLYGLQILSENSRNSWIFIKKNRDMLITKHFKNFIVYYFFFIFLAFLGLFFQFHLSKLVEELWNFL